MYTDTEAYKTQLRDVWLRMIENHPELYNLLDYTRACERAGITVF